MQEKQSFHLILTVLVVFLAVFVNLMLVGSQEESPWLLLIAMLVNTALALVFLFGSLKTSYSNSGISIKFYPFLFKEKLISWDEVTSAEIREAKPIREYGGWGVRFSRNGKAYTTQGNWGLQLVFKNKKKLFIGTQLPEDLGVYIHNLKAQGIIAKNNS